MSGKIVFLLFAIFAVVCVAQVKVTQFEYQECQRALKCKDMKCNPRDLLCNSNASRKSSCELGNSVCKQADVDFEKMAADEYMTANYYSCAQICGPKKSETSKTYYEIYECDALCGGVPLK